MCTGKAIQETGIEGLSNSRFMVLFEFSDGAAPDESGCGWFMYDFAATTASLGQTYLNMQESKL